MKYKVTLNQKTYEIEVEQGTAIVAAEYDAAAPAAAPVAAPAPVAAAPAPTATPAAAVTGNGEVVPSPLPGTVLSIKVTAGQAVKKGELLVIVEAMKMENEILAPKDGTVTQIVATAGSMIDSGAPLLVLA